MGSYTSKTKLSVEDMTFLQAKTQLDQASIQVPWHFLTLGPCHLTHLTLDKIDSAVNP